MADPFAGRSSGSPTAAIEASPALRVGNPETEYEQTLQHIRFFLDYRTKVFGFSVTINGAVLAVTLGSKEHGEIWLWGFALAVTMVCLMAEWRSVNIADVHRATARRIEADLGFRMVTDAYAYAKTHAISLRFAFRMLYFLFILIWVSRMLVGLIQWL